MFTVYSGGAMNSIVDEFISGRFVGSPYVFVTGSNRNSSGTENKYFNYLIKSLLNLSSYNSSSQHFNN